MTILEGHERVGEIHQQYFEMSDDRRVFWYFDDGSIGRIDYENDVVSVITISYEENILSMGGVIGEFGEPESYQTTHHTTEIFYLIIHFLYPDEGVVVSSHINNFFEGDIAEVDENLRVDAIYYFLPERFETVMTDGEVWGQNPEDLQRIRPWQGYGELEVGE